MERVIRQNNFGDIACNDIIIYSTNWLEMGKKLFGDYDKWTIIEPKYYLYKDDNCLIEIWNDNKGILLDNGFNKFLVVGEEVQNWSNKNREEISYKEAMTILEQKNKKTNNFARDDMVDEVVFYNREEKEQGLVELGKEINKCTAGLNQYKEPGFGIKWTIANSSENACCEIGIDYANNDTVDAMAFHYHDVKNYKTNYDLKSTEQNNGGSSDWYLLPENANTLQDLIEHRNMNGSVKDIFKACYRLGIKTEDELRDLNKMAYYSLREIGRITSRKDYITIAKELMGSQTTEKE